MMKSRRCFPIQRFNFSTLQRFTRRQPLVRTGCPTDHTERSQHDFHCQRAKDESHYTDEDGRALSTDHPQNRIRKKQQELGDEEHHHKYNAGFESLRHRINIVIS